MSGAWLRRSSLTLVLVGGSLVHPPLSTSVTLPVPGRLVAEATLHTLPALGGANTYVLLPITVHGHAMTVLLDLGTVENIVSPSALAAAGVPSTGTVDSLTIGTTLEQHVSVQDAETFATAPPPGLPPIVGLLGTSVLSHYDLVFDGPAQRVQLYAPPPATAAAPPAGPHQAWLPPGTMTRSLLSLPRVAEYLTELPSRDVRVRV